MIYIYAILAVLLLLNLGTIIYFSYLFNRISKKTTGINKHLEHVDNTVTKTLVTNPPVAAPSPNEATQEDVEEVPLSEQSPWEIPNNIKIEVEGGDTFAPYGYEVTNANS